MATERWTDEMLDKLAESVNSTKQTVESMAESIKQQSAESKELGIRFSAYQQDSQWVVSFVPLLRQFSEDSNITDTHFCHDHAAIALGSGSDSPLIL